MKIVVQIATKGICGSLKSLFVLVCNKDHMIPIYVLMHQFSCLLLVHKGSVAIFNLFILQVSNLYFLILDYWLLRGLEHANTTGSRSRF